MTATIIPKWLEQILEVESEKAGYIFSIIDNASSNSNWAATYLLFYPELHGIPTAHYNISGPLWIHMLLAPVLTVPIHPFNPIEFESRYGFNVKTFLKFVDEGRLIPIIDCDLHRYKHRSFLRDILAHERTISTSIRDNYAFRAISSDFPSIEAECERWADTVDIRNWDDGLRGSMQDWRRWYGEKTGERGLRKATSIRMARLISLNPELDQWLSCTDPSNIIKEVNIRSVTETQPVTKGLGGLYRTTEHAARLILESASNERFNDVQCEVARISAWQKICQDLTLNFPETISLKELRILLQEDVVVTANNILDELLSTIQGQTGAQGNQAPNIEQLVNALTDKWKEIASVARKLLSGDQKAHTLAQGLFSILPGNPDLLAETILKDHKAYKAIKSKISHKFSEMILYPDRMLQGKAVWFAYKYFKSVDVARKTNPS